MRHILVYSDSLSWGIIPGSRQRLAFDLRWPGALEIALQQKNLPVRIIEDCLNGRRTLWDDPFKPGRNGNAALAQRIEICSPLALVVLMLGTNDLQITHNHTAWHAAQGVATLIQTIRSAPIEPGMPVPPILVVAPPRIGTPQGPIAAKFIGGSEKSAELAAQLAEVSAHLDCHFFDANTVVQASVGDGIHLDAPDHQILALALSEKIAPLLT